MMMFAIWQCIKFPELSVRPLDLPESIVTRQDVMLPSRMFYTNEVLLNVSSQKITLNWWIVNLVTLTPDHRACNLLKLTVRQQNRQSRNVGQAVF